MQNKQLIDKYCRPFDDAVAVGVALAWDRSICRDNLAIGVSDRIIKQTDAAVRTIDRADA